MFADHGEAFLPGGRARWPTDARAEVNNTLHPVDAIQPPCADVGYQLGDALGVGIAFGLLHK